MGSTNKSSNRTQEGGDLRRSKECPWVARKIEAQKGNTILQGITFE